MNNAEKIVIDWLSWTSKKFKNVEEILAYFNFDIFDFIELDRGRYGYKKSLLSSDSKIQILYDGTEEMGINIILSGTSCRLLEGKGFDLLDLLIILSSEDFTITRLDLALDSFKNLMDKIIRKYEKNEYISKFRSTKKIENKKGDEKNGTTLYFGSRSSDIMIRIYDKAKEQKMEDTDWLRIEFEIKKEYAKNVVLKILNSNLSSVFCGLLSNYLNFVTKKEKNVSRSKICTWWLELIQDAKKIKIYRDPKEKDIDDIKKWLLKQVSTSLATVVHSDLNRNFVEKMLKEGTLKMTDKHYALIK